MQHFNFFECMPASQIDDFNLNNSNQYDIMQIEHFIHNPMPNVPMNDSERHNHFVETRTRLDVVISAIKTYYNDNEKETNETDVSTH